MKLSNLMRTWNSIRFDLKQNRIFNYFFIFFQIFMIRFGRIELAIQLIIQLIQYK